MREAGPVQFFLGTTDAERIAAAPYIAIARTQLGILKNLMTLGGLQQFGRAVTLADGTVIRCQSVMGQDIIGITPVVATAPAQAVSLATPQAPKRRVTTAGVYGWTRLPDGPPKNGHEAIWDVVGQRMLVWSGYDRALPRLSGLPAVDPISHYESSNTGWFVSQIYNAGDEGTINHSPPGASYTGSYTESHTVGGALAAILDAGEGTGWTISGVWWEGQTYPDTYGNPQATQLNYYTRTDPLDPANTQYVFAYYHNDTLVWDVYGDTEVLAGTARWALVFDDTSTPPSNFNGMNQTTYGGRWFDEAGAYLGTFRESDGRFYTSEGTTGWQAHADGYRDGSFWGRFRSLTFSSFGLPPVLPVPSAVQATLQATGYQLFELMLSNDLWQFSTAGGWQNLGTMSYNAWQDVKALYSPSPSWGPSLSADTLGPDDVGDAARGMTYVGFDIPDPAFDFVEYMFGGTIDGTDTNASSQLWRYAKKPDSTTEV